MVKARQIIFRATESAGDVSGLLVLPTSASALYVLAHGAGAGMTHPFLEKFANGLAERGVGTFRFQFPYMEQGKRAPNSRPILTETVRSAVRKASELTPGLKIVAGGKSMGGRMASLAQAEAPIEGVAGLAFLGFPLHAPGRDSAQRGDHLREVDVPMLFLQGTRDKLANLDLLKPLCDELGDQCQLHILESGDHSFKPLKSSGRSHDDVLNEAISALADWITD